MTKNNLMIGNRITLEVNGKLIDAVIKGLKKDLIEYFNLETKEYGVADTNFKIIGKEIIPSMLQNLGFFNRELKTSSGTTEEYLKDFDNNLIILKKENSYYELNILKDSSINIALVKIKYIHELQNMINIFLEKDLYGEI